MTNMDLSPLLNVAEVARRLGVTEKAVRNRVQRRSIPFRRVGTRLRFDPVEIEAWTRAHEAPGPMVLLPKSRGRKVGAPVSARDAMKALGYR